MQPLKLCSLQTMPNISRIAMQAKSYRRQRTQNQARNGLQIDAPNSATPSMMQVHVLTAPLFSPRSVARQGLKITKWRPGSSRFSICISFAAAATQLLSVDACCHPVSSGIQAAANPHRFNGGSHVGPINVNAVRTERFEPWPVIRI